MKNNEWGIVFAGGGGNGAFEIGVWKAVMESGRYNITAASGSSVGALNAALFAGGDYSIAERIWLDISSLDIIPPETRLKTGGKRSLCSANGLKGLICNDRLIDNLKRSSMPCFAACTYAPQSPSEHIAAFMDGNSVEYFDLRKESKGRIIKILLASSAIPCVFPERKIDGRYYMDGDLGGKGDCMPVQPLYDMGCRRFIVVHIDRYKPMRLSSEAAADNTAEYVHIYPPREFDNPIGILDFTRRSNRRRMALGYKCAKAALENTAGTASPNIMLNDSCALSKLKKFLHNPNFTLKVADGEKFWHVLAENSRHKLERHIFTHHARLLEKRPDGIYRIAWGSKSAFDRAFMRIFGT